MSAERDSLDEIVTGYLEGLWQFDPTRASAAGLHDFDSRIGDRSREALVAETERTRRCLERLNELPAPRSAEVNRAESLDREFFAGRLELALLELEEIRSWETDPAYYAEQMDLSNMMLRETAPFEQRVVAIVSRLERFPGLIEASRNNVRHPKAPFVQRAIEVYRGLEQFLRADLAEVVGGLNDAGLRVRAESALARAADATGSHALELEREVLPRASHDFAFGKERFLRLLRLGEHVDLSIADLQRVAQGELGRLRRQLADTLGVLYPRLTVTKALHRYSEECPTVADFTAVAASQIEGLKEFVLQNGIASVPEGRCVVRTAPPFARWNSAYISVPGPFESVSTEAIYFIAPVDPLWGEDEQRDYLRANNRYALSNTTCHEVYPGHYLASLFSRGFASTVQKVFFCYSTGEGWAHYVEQLVLDEGFAEQDLGFRVEQIRDALLRAARLRCALGLHTEDWSVARAEQFFRAEAFQDPVNARQQAARGTFDPSYLNYTLGKMMILKLRSDYRLEQGTRFRLKSFHDALLGLALPIPLARRALLARDPDGALV